MNPAPIVKQINKFTRTKNAKFWKKKIRHKIKNSSNFLGVDIYIVLMFRCNQEHHRYRHQHTLKIFSESIIYAEPSYSARKTRMINMK